MKRRNEKNFYKPFKQGVYFPTRPEKYVGATPIIYRSSWELKFFRWCEVNDNVLEWTSESNIIPYRNPNTGRMHRYFVDNSVVIKEGSNISKYLIEIKPKKQKEGRKWSEPWFDNDCNKLKNSLKNKCKALKKNHGDVDLS